MLTRSRSRYASRSQVPVRPNPTDCLGGGSALLYHTGDSNRYGAGKRASFDAGRFTEKSFGRVGKAAAD